LPLSIDISNRTGFCKNGGELTMIELCRSYGASPRRRHAVKISIGLGFCVIPFLVSAQPARPQIQISPGNCTSGVHLVARDARLSEVLESLSKSLAFQLQFEGTTDSVVDVNVSMPAPELVAKLSPVDSVIVAQSRDPQCPRQSRIVKVWVLPKANEAKLGPVAPTQTQDTSRRFDEMSRQAKEAYQLYEHTHGKPPPGVEEEVAKPR
jgi:hypothetical protein